jgi:transposase
MVLHASPPRRECGEHRTTNAASESINTEVQWVRYTARGFRNKQIFIHAIYFHCD